MDERVQSFSPSYSQPDSQQTKQTNSSSSGLTLVIPSLRSLKATQSASKAKSRSGSQPLSASVYQDAELQERKIARPVKLKPLKEVLAKLIAQLKKKDDYAFFLHPVDVANVPGYSDIIKRPMDLGTMSDKVNRGKYRSLEEFAADFRLVTNNAKTFNPPGSIYYTEADRLEAWGLDHIAKASSTVIQYETDWNIDVERDEYATPVNIDGDDEDNASAPTPMDLDTASLRERSTSVVSQIPQVPGPSGRRGPRGPYRKQGQSSGATGAISETLEPDGGLPGSKDGLGAFPPGSDWAKTMLALKLKGKRYKTKKERLRFEREGPPLHADGSLDYTEMEDPFSVLSFFVPDPPTRPHLVPVYPPLFTSPESSSSHPAQAPPTFPISQLQQESSSSSHTPRSHFSPGPQISTSATASASSSASAPPFPGATTLSLDRPALSIPFLQQLQIENDSSGKRKAKQGEQVPPSSQAATSSLKPATTTTQRKRRHWTIVRNSNSYRQKGKEREDYYNHDLLQQDSSVSGVGSDSTPAAAKAVSWNTPREAQATDFGSFTVLAGALAEEMQKRFGSSSNPSPESATAASATMPTPTPGHSSHSTFSALPAVASTATAVTAATTSTHTSTTTTQGVSTDQSRPGSRTDQDVTLELIRESLDCCASAAKSLSQSHTPALLSGSSVGGGDGSGKGKSKADSMLHVNGTSSSGSVTGSSASAKAAEYYFTTQRAAEAEAYLRDWVYGGLEGFAYVRSLAEFVNGDCYYKDGDGEDLGMDTDGDMGMDVDEETKPSRDVNQRRLPHNPTLGMPLAQWVVQNIVDPLTEGRHSLLREAALELARQQPHLHSFNDISKSQYPAGSVAAQVHASLHLYPAALLALSALMQIRLHKIDMGSLIKTPNELFLSEEEWFGKTLKERRRNKLEQAALVKAKTLVTEHVQEKGHENEPIKENGKAVHGVDAMEVEEEEEEPERTWVNVDASEKQKQGANDAAAKGRATRSSVTYEQEGPEELNEVLDYVANLIVELDKRNRGASVAGSVNGHTQQEVGTQEEDHSSTTTRAPTTSLSATSANEDPLIRNLRLNLLALAKRAPLDTIARLPKDLVPEHIRHFVPTLGSNT